jgi:hypothetical protein
MTYTTCCWYRIVPPDDEQQACSKHVEADYWNNLIKNCASCWFMLYGYICLIYTYIVYTYKHLSKSTTSLLFSETEISLKNLNEPPLFAILCHVNLTRTLLYYFLKSHCSIIFPYKPTFIKWSLPFGFPDWNFICIFLFRLCLLFAPLIFSFLMWSS